MPLSRADMAALCALQKRHSIMNLHEVGKIECEQAREKAKVTKLLKEFPNQEEPMMILDLSAPVEQMSAWRAHLPNVKPFYAVKCNNNSVLLETLVALNSGFDCASKAEIELMLSLGVDPKNIVFANPCKQKSHILYAREKGITMTTLDNVCEVGKLKKYWPEVNVLLRIATDDSAAICQFSSKFGSTMEDCPALIQSIKDNGLNMTGVSFHVGSGCGDPKAFVDAAANARLVFDMARKQGFEMKMLDIGGGFPGDQHFTPSFEEIATPLHAYLEEHFSDVEIIAEPGRYFACRSHTIAANVFGHRVIKSPNLEHQYFVNDGTYQSFNCIYFDHAVALPYPLPWDPDTNSPRGDGEMHPVNQESLLAEKPAEGEFCSTIFGPTCDALDCISKRVNFPKVEVGDWIYFANMGAYTCSAASSFNGFYKWRTILCATKELVDSNLL